VEREVRKRPEALRLMTHPGVGPLTALAFVLIIGTWERFPRGKPDRQLRGDDSE
jgi:transposase